MKSYVFRVVIEKDEDVYHAYCPALKDKAAYTWGRTEEEALKHIQEVVQMVIEEMLKEGDPIPTGSKVGVQVSEEPLVLVTV